MCEAIGRFLTSRTFLTNIFAALLLFSVASLLLYEKSLLNNSCETEIPECVFSGEGGGSSNNNNNNNKAADAGNKVGQSGQSRLPRKFTFPKRSHTTFSYHLKAVFHEDSCNLPASSKGTSESSAEVESSILYEFSPFVNSHVKAMFAEHVLGESWFALYPFQASCSPFNQHLYCAIRIWLRLDRFQAPNQLRNRYQDNFMYLLELNEKLDFVEGSGRLLSIPSPIQSLFYNGPEDPRLFECNNTLYLNFLNGHAYGDSTDIMRRQFLWSIEKSLLHDIDVADYSFQAAEKNWTPWEHEGNLYFIHQLLPDFNIMKCEIPEIGRKVACKFVQGHGYSSTFDVVLRGGSPFVHYTGDYYVATTHSVQASYPEAGQLYAAQLTLMNGRTKRIILVSSPILMNPDVMKFVKTTAPIIDRPFLYSRSIFVESPNSIVCAACLNDNQCYLLRLTGIEELLKRAIENDQKLEAACGNTTAYSRYKHSYGGMVDWLKAMTVATYDSYFKGKPDIA